MTFLDPHCHGDGRGNRADIAEYWQGFKITIRIKFKGGKELLRMGASYLMAEEPVNFLLYPAGFLKKIKPAETSRLNTLGEE